MNLKMYVSASQWVREITREGDVATCCRHQHILVFGILEPRNFYAQRGLTTSNKTSVQMVSDELSGIIERLKPWNQNPLWQES